LPPIPLRALLAVGLATGLAISFAPAAAGAPATGGTDPAVAELRHEADLAAQAYFDALAQSKTLEAQVAAIESQLPALQERRRELRGDARRRAAEAYVRSGTQTALLFDASNAADAARRSPWLNSLSARDDASFHELARATTELGAQKRELQQAQTAQHSALDELETQSHDINAKLQAAEDRERSAQAAAAKAVAPAASRPVVPKGTDGAPPSAPPDYSGTPGVHPQHDQPFLACTRARESHGNYAAYNPAGPYMGAYQFQQGTWNSAANHAGRPELIGVPPHTASQYDQDDLAWALYQWQGSRPWGGYCG
jgi:hypothetical protein